MINNQNNTNQNAKVALNKAKNLLNITKTLLVKQENNQLVEDNWIERLWKWANENNIPDHKIPRNKDKLLSLRFLDFNRQQISEIPSEVGNLSNLKEINFGHNYLTKLPKEIAQLRNLEKLSVSNNKLTSLPKEIAQLRNLKELSVGYNNLTSLPNEVCSLINLTSLELCRNKLKNLPEKIVYLRKLNYLWIQDNENLILDNKQKEWLTYLDKQKKCFVYAYDDLLNIVIKDNNRKYWIDDNTDLMWDIDLVFCTWTEAFDYVKKLNTEEYKGYNDWRIPEIDELKTLIDKEQYKSINGDYFYINPSLAYSTKRVYDEDACYWSKDTYANNHNYADVIDFLDGTESCAHKNLKQYLRCVRDNSEFDEDLDDN
ncbi:DUF1566 domain-containing protein [Aliarcobacter cryaerophilus]|uniref:Lcl domain-containing protein n=1 Tax=Aliarcobacter cryaerophilus TaxID=28198 RepID=UPI001B5E9A5F|nr:DUF1566 domain-containing protein [Aliarcobacter cryaerophilus]MBP9616470.1 DUF1566 domain-containing protein [Aliarcobacter sp.]MCT7507756.1 DUF1566 domain-containing protein [Aliarcobacter cryaerophilus]